MLHPIQLKLQLGVLLDLPTQSLMVETYLCFQLALPFLQLLPVLQLGLPQVCCLLFDEVIFGSQLFYEGRLEGGIPVGRACASGRIARLGFLVQG